MTLVPVTRRLKNFLKQWFMSFSRIFNSAHSNWWRLQIKALLRSCMGQIDIHIIVFFIEELTQFFLSSRAHNLCHPWASQIMLWAAIFFASGLSPWWTGWVKIDVSTNKILFTFERTPLGNSRITGWRHSASLDQFCSFRKKLLLGPKLLCFINFFIPAILQIQLVKLHRLSF